MLQRQTQQCVMVHTDTPQPAIIWPIQKPELKVLKIQTSLKNKIAV